MRGALPYRGGYGFIYCPAAPVNSPMYKFILYAKYIRPFREGFSFSAKLNESVIAFVPVVFLCCNPTTVTFFVMTVIVNSVYLVFYRWHSPHIEEKIFKPKPPTANLYSPATVSVEVFSIFIMASTLNRLPYNIFVRLCQAMCCHPFRGLLSRIASTACRFKFCKVVLQYLFIRAACAFALPIWIVTSVFGKSYNTQAAKC